MSVDGLARLEAIEDIRQLKARYFRLLDTKDWDGMATVFTTDAELDVSGEVPDGGVIRGNQNIAEFVKSAGSLPDAETVHHGHMPEIDVLTDSTARGVWAMEDMLRWPAGFPIRTLHGYGHYHETYEKVDGRWLIKTLKLTRLRRDVEFGAAGD